jgi:hypothetical protein
MCDQAHSLALPNARQGISLSVGLGRLLDLLRPRLDLESLSDHLKRDLGFADGRAPAPRDLLRD